MGTQNEQESLIAPALLLVAAVLGFVISNSALSGWYLDFLNTKILFGIGGKQLIHKSVLLLINDGLMAIFFLFIGLELKREIIVGELSDSKKAMLPIFAAIGGMMIPALLYTLFNMGGDGAKGWGIPMATDIAFALGILAVLGSRVPISLKVFLTAVAIVDDLGAIIVIALFYTSSVDYVSLMAAMFFFALCVGANRMGIMKLSIYMLLGIPLWYFMLKSGIHATIAGVLLAFTIPLASKRESTAKLLEDILYDQRSAVDSPAVFMEKSLYKWVGLFIIPIFAFCNSGVVLDGVKFGSVAIGIIAGLSIGKPLGVVGFSFLATKIGVASLPKGVVWRQIIGVGFLSGVGFTMALFINSLAFDNIAASNEAKLGILIASFIAGSIGALMILKSIKKPAA